VLATVLARADVVGQLFVCEIHKTVRGVPAKPDMVQRDRTAWLGM